MRNLANKYRETILYLIFGILAVTVNTISYMVLASVMSELSANTIAFLITVLFAYWTNSTFVFGVKSTWKRFASFSFVRLIALPIDDIGLLVMIHAGISPLIAKAFMNVILIIFNYLMSKLFIFKKRNKERV